ncbi:MAG: hypothetical protein H6Q89_1727 [Myxococcaceae bacterium]|nr:hypothetical protein [Myxococcaceae bacterium]
MLTTALLLMFASADVQPAFLNPSAPRRIRLLADEPLPPAPPAELPSYAGWSKAQLEREYDRLKEERPSIGLPIALMSSGAAALAISLNLVMLGLLSAGGVNNASIPFLAVFGIVGTGGAAMLIIGGIVLSRVLPERRPYSLQLDEVQRLLKEGGEELAPEQRQYVPDAPPIIGPPPEGPPPPPLPPYSPQASVQFPLIFARF